jgi:hypothetical protein
MVKRPMRARPPHRIGRVGEPADRLGQGQRRALGVGEERRVTPGGHREDAVVGLAELAGDLGVLYGADAAAVDLARAQVHELQHPRRDADAADRLGQLRERVHRAGHRERRVGDPRLEGRRFHG